MARTGRLHKGFQALVCEAAQVSGGHLCARARGVLVLLHLKFAFDEAVWPAEES